MLIQRLDYEKKLRKQHAAKQEGKQSSGKKNKKMVEGDAPEMHDEDLEFPELEDFASDEVAWGLLTLDFAFRSY